MEIESVKRLLGDDAELFDFEEKDGVVSAKLKSRVDKTEFKRLATILKEIGGEYVPFNYSSNLGAYFRFKKEEAISEKKDILLKDIFAYADDIEKRGETIMKQAEIIKEKLKELQK